MKCNYIKQKLTKKITKYYFKQYRNVLSKKNFPVSTKTIKQLHYDVINNSKNVSKEYFNMVVDLVNIDLNSYKSKMCKELFATINSLSLKVKTQKMSSDAKLVANILSKHSTESYIVGGYVRDVLFGNESKDVDFVTDIPMIKVNKIFKALGFSTKDVGHQFLVTIVSINGSSFEIANFRKDKDNTGGKAGTIIEDAQRRDFTVNALYYNISCKKIVDPNGTSIDSILSKELKFVGDPIQRLLEDEIRGWRFYRFITKGLKPSTKTLKAVRANWINIYANSNPERVRREVESLIGLI